MTGVTPADGTAPAPRPPAPAGPPASFAQPATAPQERTETPAAPAFMPHPEAGPEPQRQVPPAPAPGPMNGNGASNGQCTAPQLRRFIKSRPYVPMHELRRRFGIDGDDDDVTSVRLELGWVYVGLPNREGSLLGELLKAGEIGYELSLDPRTPIVIGVYPMRPIPRG